jgi:DNA-directed RNA polymerase sigma subunit (sigma70/sigma32)
MLNKVARLSSHLLRETGREPTAEEIEKLLGISPHKFYHLCDMQKVVSLDKPLSDEGTYCLSDFIEDKKSVFPGDLVDRRGIYKCLEEMMERLTPQEKKVLTMRYGIGDESVHTLERAGQVLSLTRQRIKQIEDKALSKLTKFSNNRGLRAFIEA